MPAPLLTADLGNSACKLRLWESASGEPRPVRAVSLPARGGAAAGLAAEVEAWLRQGPPATHVALSAVGDTDLEQALRGAFADCGLRVAAPAHGLELDVREAHTVGSDRLYAARGAADRVDGSALVLDAGTALTVDALEVRAQGRRRVFRGGAIAVGPELAASALAAAAARLVRVRPRPGAAALGRSTPEALEAGAVIGFRGAALELVRAVGEESGLDAPPLVLTGGARGFLLEPPLFEGRQLVVVEDLVHLGLLAALLDELAGGRSSSRGAP